MPTIKDVAKKSGVSIATVSNILNNKASVSEEIYQRVYSAMEELDYKPNMLARNLKSNGVKFVGIIVPAFLGIYQDIIEGIQRELSEYDFYLITRTTNDMINKEKKLIDEFIGLGVCGIFVVTSFRDMEYYKKAADAGISLVFIERTVDELNYSSVVFDNRSMVRNLLRSLLTKTCKVEELWLITGDLSYSSERDFLEGAYLAVEEAGMQAKELKRSQVSFSELQAFADMMNLIGRADEIPPYVILSSERILESFMEMLSIYDRKDTHIFVPVGERWSSAGRSESICEIPRRAVYCGKRCAQLMLEFVKKPATNENTQIVIPTQEVKEEQLISYIPALHRPLKILLTSNAMTTALLRLLPAFMRESGIQVETKIFTYQQELYEEIMKQYESGSSEYDVYMMDSPWIEYFRQIQCVLTLNPYLEKEKEYVKSFVPEIWNKLNGGNGRIIGIPLVSMTQLLLYRRDLFKSPVLQRAYYRKNGLELGLPSTWTEYNFLAKFFTREFTKDSPTEYGTCLLGKKPNGLIQEFFPRQWSFHGAIMNKNQVVIDSLQNVRAVRNLMEAYECSLPQIWDLMENEQIEAFAKGNIAFISTYSGHIKSILDSQFGSIGDRLGYAVLPGKYSLVGSWLLAVNGNCQNPDTAFSFIKWITSGTRAMQCSVLGGFMPKQTVNLSEQIKTIYPWNEHLEDYVKMERQRENIRNAKGTYINNYSIEGVIADGLQDVLCKKCGIEEMLEDCKEQIKAMVREWK